MAGCENHPETGYSSAGWTDSAGTQKKEHFQRIFISLSLSVSRSLWLSLSLALSVSVCLSVCACASVRVRKQEHAQSFSKNWLIPCKLTNQYWYFWPGVPLQCLVRLFIDAECNMKHIERQNVSLPSGSFDETENSCTTLDWISHQNKTHCILLCWEDAVWRASDRKKKQLVILLLHQWGETNMQRVLSCFFLQIKGQTPSSTHVTTWTLTFVLANRFVPILFGVTSESGDVSWPSILSTNRTSKAHKASISLFFRPNPTVLFDLSTSSCTAFASTLSRGQTKIWSYMPEMEKVVGQLKNKIGKSDMFWTPPNSSFEQKESWLSGNIKWSVTQERTRTPAHTHTGMSIFGLLVLQQMARFTVEFLQVLAVWLLESWISIIFSMYNAAFRERIWLACQLV